MGIEQYWKKVVSDNWLEKNWNYLKLASMAEHAYELQRCSDLQMILIIWQGKGVHIFWQTCLKS